MTTQACADAWRELQVVALATVDKHDSPDDACVAGVYRVEADPSLSQNDAASAALDAFHGNVAVDTLDEFEFFVLDAGRVIDPNPDREGYTLSSRARALECVASGQGEAQAALATANKRTRRP